MALPIGGRSQIARCHKEAVIWSFQLHQGLVFRMGTVAVNAFFELTQRTVRRCIDHLLRTFDMPASIA